MPAERIWHQIIWPQTWLVGAYLMVSLLIVHINKITLACNVLIKIFQFPQVRVALQAQAVGALGSILICWRDKAQYKAGKGWLPTPQPLSPSQLKLIQCPLAIHPVTPQAMLEMLFLRYRLLREKSYCVWELVGLIQGQYVPIKFWQTMMKSVFLVFLVFSYLAVYIRLCK